MGEYIIDNGELYHYGVKGMKWGVRKDRKRYVVINGRKVPVTRFNGQMETKEMLAHKPKNKDVFRDIHVMSKLKTKDDIQEWSENEDAKIRDDLFYGKITKKEAQRRSDLLASRTAYMLNAVNGRQFVNNNHIMNLSVQQANQFAMEQATRASINASLQAASLGMSGGMNPFMFGMM
jgi:hypothetical protein